MGQGAFSILKLGQAMRQLTLESRDFFGDGQLYSEAEGVVMARAVFAASIPIALVVYGFGFFWLVMAVAGTAQAFRKGMSFNLSWRVSNASRFLYTLDSWRLTGLDSPSPWAS